MSGRFYDLAGPLIRLLDGERAHRAAIFALKAGLVPRPPGIDAPVLKTKTLGLEFPNPVGLAPGFDKNGEIIDAMLAQGFGFVEIGTVTPRPQDGNRKPRLFRLAQDRAVINRMGFNNDGHQAVLERLQARRLKGGIIGVNIGANKDSTDKAGDYVAGLEAFSNIASYLTINISSPNTPGLRNLQSGRELEQLLQRLNAARQKQAHKPAMLIKIAPDLETGELEHICALCMAGMADGLIISNTTVSRPPLKSGHRGQAGGLSGAPLFEMSTRMLATACKLTGGKVLLVGAGGISDARGAFEKIRAGASLVQLYTAMVYKGPGLANEIAAGLAKLCARHNFKSIKQATGSAVDQWT